jgi:hypothetical protein
LDSLRYWIKVIHSADISQIIKFQIEGYHCSVFRWLLMNGANSQTSWCDTQNRNPTWPLSTQVCGLYAKASDITDILSTEQIATKISTEWRGSMAWILTMALTNKIIRSDEFVSCPLCGSWMGSNNKLQDGSNYYTKRAYRR